MNDKWKPVGHAEIQRWDEPGQTLEGRWRGTKPGHFGDLGILEKPNGGIITFPLHTVLASKMSDVRLGVEVMIEYHGKTRSKKSGKEYKDFSVYVASAEDVGEE